MPGILSNILQDMFVNDLFRDYGTSSGSKTSFFTGESVSNFESKGSTIQQGRPQGESDYSIQKHSNYSVRRLSDYAIASASNYSVRKIATRHSTGFADDTPPQEQEQEEDAESNWSQVLLESAPGNKVQPLIFDLEAAKDATAKDATSSNSQDGLKKLYDTVKTLHDNTKIIIQRFQDIRTTLEGNGEGTSGIYPKLAELGKKLDQNASPDAGGASELRNAQKQLLCHLCSKMTPENHGGMDCPDAEECTRLLKKSSELEAS